MTLMNQMEYSSEESINELPNDDQDLVKLFHLYLETNNFREARNLIRKHKEIQRLSPKDLNNEYPMKDYRFTSRNGVLSIDSTKAQNNKITFERKQVDINNEIDEFKSSQQVLNNHRLERLNEIEYKNKAITDDVNRCCDTINQILIWIHQQ